MPDPDQRPVSSAGASRRRREEVLVELAAAGRVLDDHPVGDPLDRRAVVGPRVASPSPSPAGSGARAAAAAAEARPARRTRSRPGAPASSSNASRILLKRSAGQTATQSNSCVSVPEIPSSRLVVAGHRRDVEREDPARLEPLARELEELPRREVEGHVRLVVGVDDDQVVALVRAPEERPRVGVVAPSGAGCPPCRTSAARPGSRPDRARRRRSRRSG